MELNSCLYECRVTHQRLAPRRYGLRHALFMCYLDLDELATLAGRSRWFSHNRRNLYSFYDADHLPLSVPSSADREPAHSGQATDTGSLKHSVLAYLATQNLHLDARCRIMLLTLPRIAGYVFNPISVYFCFNPAGAPVCAIAEVGNTFRERKLYLLDSHHLQDGRRFQLRTPKHYYVSPFSSLTLLFDFRLGVPDGALDIHIDDYDGERKVLVSALEGRRLGLQDARLLWFALKYPLLTLKVIGLIHWHALKLWLKGLPWHRKSDGLPFQRDVLNPSAQLSASVAHRSESAQMQSHSPAPLQSPVPDQLVER